MKPDKKLQLISGHPILVPQAKENLAKWRTNQPVTVNYVFKLTDPAIVKVRVPKGNAFDRLWLRMFHLATYTEQPRCQNIVRQEFVPASPEWFNSLP